MKITKARLKRIIKEELGVHNTEKFDDTEEAVTEGIENLTVENIQLAINVLSQLAVTIGIPIAVSSMVINKLKKYIASKNETPI